MSELSEYLDELLGRAELDEIFGEAQVEVACCSDTAAVTSDGSGGGSPLATGD